MPVLTIYGTAYQFRGQRIAVRVEVDPENLDSVKVMSDGSSDITAQPAEIELSCEGTLTLRQLLTVARALEHKGWRVT